MNYDTVENNEQITILPDSEWQQVIMENDYSLEEKLIGKWQGEPLYRRCYNAKTPTTLNTLVDILDIPNKADIKAVHKCYAYAGHTESNAWPIGYESPNNLTSALYWGGGVVRCWVQSSGWANQNIIVVLEYTKKAD